MDKTSPCLRISVLIFIPTRALARLCSSIYLDTLLDRQARLAVTVGQVYLATQLDRLIL